MKEKIVQITDFLNGHFKYDPFGQKIWMVEPSGNHKMIADLRGWGAIQHLFENKDGKIDTEKAAKFQDYLGAWMECALQEFLEKERSLQKSLSNIKSGGLE